MNKRDNQQENYLKQKTKKSQHMNVYHIAAQKCMHQDQHHAQSLLQVVLHSYKK